jgi:hypothetical protein
VDAVHHKYASELMERKAAPTPEQQIHISASKVIEEVGFEKIRVQLAQLQELKIVIVDGLCIASAEEPRRTIEKTCPKIVELDLSRNLFETPDEIVRICSELDHLRILRLNGNRMKIPLMTEDRRDVRSAFAGIREVELDETLMTWGEACYFLDDFINVTSLSMSSNELTALLPVPISPSISNWNLRSITLDYNDFTSLTDLTPLTSLPHLQKMHLKGNRITSITPRDSTTHSPLTFGPYLHHLDLSSNCVSSWTFVDSLLTVFPGLISLRFSHNPIYEGDGSKAKIEEGFMLTVAKLATLKVLNYSTVTAAERTNAEMWYLGRIGREMGSVAEEREGEVTARHPRYKELCELYGEPMIVRGSKAVNPNWLEARLIRFSFTLAPHMMDEQGEERTKSTEIPKGFDVYQVKGIVGRLFGLPPLSLSLIWETGEYDPVAGYEDEEESDEDDEEVIADGEKLGSPGVQSEKGKWMKREVELENGTRQIGFWIDGLEAKVRVEKAKSSV